MRKKKETPSVKIGRPKNSGLNVPGWAGKAIHDLSGKSGVSPQKILEVALRDGIQLVGEPLGAWIKYQESTEKLFNEHAKNHKEADGPEPAETAKAPDGNITLQSDERIAAQTDDDRLVDVDFERRLRPEVPEDHETVQALSNGD